VKSPRVIALLLALNLGLFLGIFAYFRKAQLDAPVAVANSEAALADSTSPPDAPAPAEKVVAVTNQFRWAQVESEDYKTYIARLRSIGCPEQTIRDIIIADLDKLLAPAVQAASGHRPDLKYWQSVEEELANDVDPGEVARQQREIDKRKREIIRELVNTDLLRERMKQHGQEDYYERRLSFLPEERRSHVRDLLEKYDEAAQAIRDKELEDGESLSISERTQLRTLEQQREEEMSKFLSPQEKTQYDLWASPTANAVRYAFYGMSATEQEFLAVYQARKAFDDKWASRDAELIDAASRAQMEHERAQVAEQIHQALGDRRYAEFQRGEDEEYHILSSVATRSKLPREKAAEVFGYKLLAQGYRDQIRNDPSPTEEQRREALKSIADESEKAVRASLGEKAYRRYLATGGGKWIKE